MNRILGLAAALALAGEATAADLQRHFYLTADEDSLASLRRHAGDIDLVSPQWFHIDASGRLVSRADDAIVAWAKQKKARLMPLVLNEDFKPEIAHLVFTDARVQEDLLRDLIDAGVRLRLRGFQIDFENVAAEDRGLFTAFIRRAADELRRRGLRLSVAVPAPLWKVPSAEEPEPVNDRARAFDYRALAAATDFITVMAYDQHTSPDNPGPVSGRPWLLACLTRLLTEVPAKRLMLGVPLYYRRFLKARVVEGPYAEGEALALAQRAPIVRDPNEGEDTFSFDEGKEHNVVWLQSAAILRERLELARRLRLAGFSAWRLGHEDPQAWPYLSGRK